MDISIQKRLLKESVCNNFMYYRRLLGLMRIMLRKNGAEPQCFTMTYKMHDP